VTALLQLPGWLGSALAMLAAIFLATLPFLAVRHILADELPPKTGQVAETVTVRVGALHALILALVFAEAQSTHAELRQEVSKEIATIEHIALRLNQWDGPEVQPIRGQLAAYVSAVLQNEWRATSRAGGSGDARHAYDALDLGLLDLKADTPRRLALQPRLIADMDALQDHRKVRLSLFHRSLPGLFWWMALVGFAITVGFFFVFPATLAHLAMLSVYGAYTGLVLYFILALSHPYIGPAAIDTSPYSVVLEQELGTRQPMATQ
jgi:Protein of unknown function (DUF4239)